MGLGDNLLATGMARGARARGKRIAFGDGRQIIWDHYSEHIFKGNPNIAPPGSERDSNLEWIHFCRGHRIYNRQNGRKWVWNYGFQAIPGEVFFTEDEIAYGDKFGSGFVVIEPNVPNWKSCAVNKDWGSSNYQKLARYLVKKRLDVRQFVGGGCRHKLLVGNHIKTPTFRHALAVLSKAALYIGPEGGLHHAAAALGIPAVVIFGGFIPPQVTGYETHINLTGGAEACGSLFNCRHCRQAMARISIDEVHAAALKLLRDRLEQASPAPVDMDRVRPEADAGRSICDHSTLDTQAPHATVADPGAGSVRTPRSGAIFAADQVD